MTLRSAVVGAGTVSHVHLSGLQRSPLTELVGVCDVKEAAAIEMAEEYDTQPFYDLEEMVADIELDWLHLCTPVQTHLDLAIIAIEAGIPVQIEKPITETYAEFRRLEAVAKANDSTVSAVHNHVFDPAMRIAMRDRGDGQLGEVKGVDMLYTGSSLPDDPNRGAWNFELAGGEFEEGLPHALYLTLRAGGYPRSPSSIRASTVLYGDYDRPFDYDGAQVQFDTAEGVLCTTKILGGTIPNRVLLVHGTEASLTVDFVSQTVERHDRPYKSSSLLRAMNNVDRAGDRLLGTVGNVRQVVRRMWNDDWATAKALNGHYHQIDLEARAILEGSELPVPFDEARWTTRLMQAIRDDASERSEPVAAPPDELTTPTDDP